VKVTRAAVSIQAAHRGRAKEIRKDDVRAFVPRTPASGELVAASGKSYLIEVAGAKAPFQRLPRFSIDYEWTSTFDYLLFLNRVSGRSFHDPARYPVFPALIRANVDVRELDARQPKQFAEPTSIEKVENTAAEFAEREFVAPEFFCFPELVRGPLPKWAETPFDFVYGMRQLLESDLASLWIPNWIRALWEPGHAIRGISHEPILTIWPSQKKPDEPTAPLITFHVAETLIAFAWLSEESIGCVSRSGKILNFGLGTKAITAGKSDDIAGDFGDFEFFTLRRRLLIYDRCDRTLATFGTEEKQEIQIESRLLSECNAVLVYCPNRFEVRTVDRILCKTDSEIVAIAASSPFQMVVIATADCKVHFHSARKGNKTMPSCQIDAFVDDILITEKWGFVLLHSTEMLYLYNLNGTEIKKVPLAAPVLKWTTFSNTFGFDYVACANAKEEIIFFEAFYPEKATVVGQAADVVCLAFDDASQRIIVVTADAAFTAIPCAIWKAPLKNLVDG
jgi:hypothetical protein